jgi:putative nucleotidyltransferase with HDIG domain
MTGSMGRILIVDDEKSIRLTLSEFLKHEGFEAATAGDAVIACSMIAEAEYDVVVTDIVMPRISGMDLLTTLRKSSKTLQVIIMTGEPSVDTAIRAVQQGATDYLTKPINKDILLKTVRNAVSVKKLTDDKALLEKENLYYQKQLEELVGQRTKSLQNVMQGIIYLLTSVVEARDPYTAGHQLRVGNLSAAIADKMNMGLETVDLVRTIGYIHDIGKISVPAEILSKPGRLSPLEMEMIKIHAYKGFEMISKTSLPGKIGQAIHQHHERADGSGYPLGVRDDDIIDEAKILIVADVVEAMVSHRPYRPALGLDKALDEIAQKSGTLYNERIVTACVSLFRDDMYSIEDDEKHVHIPL